MIGSSKVKNFMSETFDIVFIMLLCFATLLSTMLMRGKVIVGSGAMGGFEYSFNITTFLITIGSLGVYLLYIIINSEKELRRMIGNSYDNKEMDKVDDSTKLTDAEWILSEIK